MAYAVGPTKVSRMDRLRRRAPSRVQHALNAARELTDFCRYLGIPFGFNIESVSSRRVEIEAEALLT